MNALRRLIRRPEVPEIDLRAHIGLADPVHWFERAKLEKRTRYVMAQRNREIERGRAALEGRLPAMLARQAYLGSEAELLEPAPEFDDWRDAAADDAGIPRVGEI